MNHFHQISLLITHYNRSKSLENLLNTFQHLGCVFGNVIVSDDGSSSPHLEHVEYLRSVYLFKLMSTPVNKGLGNNINKGQDAVTTPYTLYIQEDFEPTEKFRQSLIDALDFMEKEAELDIIRFWSYFPFPYLRQRSKGFGEMYIKPFAVKYNKIHFYSDTPHLRRSSFFQKFGRYVEGISGDETEYRMALSFILNKAKGLFYINSNDLFVHRNTPDEPSTMPRTFWSLSMSLQVRLMRAIYKQIRFNYDIHIAPRKKKPLKF